VVDWQARHPELLKVADIKGREALTAPVRQTHET